MPDTTDNSPNSNPNKSPINEQVIRSVEARVKGHCKIGNIIFTFTESNLDNDIKKIDKMVKDGDVNIAPIGYATTWSSAKSSGS